MNKEMDERIIEEILRGIDDFAKALDEKFGSYAIHGILYPCSEILEKADRARFYELFFQWMETGEVQIVEVKPELTRLTSTITSMAPKPSSFSERSICSPTYWKR